MGPARADLGDFAKIDVSENYRFTGRKGALLLLQRMRNPIPQNLAGIVAPASGKWWIVLVFSEVGYVQALDQGGRIDAAAVLQAVQGQLPAQNAQRVRQGVSPIDSVEWAIPPVVDTNHCTLEWAIRARTHSEKMVNLRAETENQAVVNHTIRMMGRRGVLDATAVQPDEGADAIPLRDLVQKISFNEGERYADYRTGDKTAKLGLEQLIVGEEARSLRPAYVVPGIWIGSILLAGGLVTGGVLLIRRQFRQAKQSRAYPAYREHGHALAHIMSGSGNGSASGNGSNRRSGSRQKRTFDYQKYYSDMLLEVSAGSFFLSAPPVNGRRVSSVADGRPVPAGQPIDPAAVRVNSELIANQTHLIEEQNRLLQEQAKLIEEKSRMIEERNRLLAKQTELLEREVL